MRHARGKSGIKSTGQHGQERGNREAKLEQLLVAIEEYAPENFHRKEFERGLSWADKHRRSIDADDPAYPFGDPLEVAMYLASARADRETILATLLAPIVYGKGDGN